MFRRQETTLRRKIRNSFLGTPLRDIKTRWLNKKRRLKIRGSLGFVSAEYYKEQVALPTEPREDSRAQKNRVLERTLWGVPLIAWIILLIGLAIVGAVIVQILSNKPSTSTTVGTSSTPPLLLTWNSELPPSMGRGVRGYAQLRLANTGSTVYSNAVLFVNVTTNLFSIANPSILTVDIPASSQLWGGQTLSLSTGGGGGGLLGQSGPTTISSVQAANVDISVLFNANAPGATYTLQFWVQQ